MSILFSFVECEKTIIQLIKPKKVEQSKKNLIFYGDLDGVSALFGETTLGFIVGSQNKKKNFVFLATALPFGP